VQGEIGTQLKMVSPRALSADQALDLLHETSQRRRAAQAATVGPVGQGLNLSGLVHARLA
jgi:hypothetical protein